MEILWSEVWKGGFQLMQILVLLGMLFDAVVAEVKKNLLLFRLALAMLWFYALWDVKNTKSCGKFMVNSPENNPSCIHTSEAFRHIFINSWFASYWPFILGKKCLLRISFDISESFIEQKGKQSFYVNRKIPYWAWSNH